MPERPERLLVLPRPSRAAWLALLVVGLVLTGVSVPAVARDLDAAPPIVYLVLGAGLFLTFFPLLILFTRETAARLRLGGDSLVIECSGGDSVEVPLGSLAAVHLLAEGNGDSRVLSLQKKDGGWLELGTLPDVDRAENIAGPLREALAAQLGPRSSSAEDPLDRLQTIGAIRLERHGDTVTLAWGAGYPLGAFLFLGPITGMLSIVYGFHRYEGGLGTLLAMAFVATLGLVLLIVTVLNLGVVQRLRIDGRELSVERLRFGKVLKRQTLPIGNVAAVDYSHKLSVIGAGLTLRSAKGQMVHDQALGELKRGAEELGEEDDLAGAALVASTVMKTLGSGVHVPLGKLSLAAKIALDLAIGEEVARRTGRAAGQM
jgi:hypothetical protein